MLEGEVFHSLWGVAVLGCCSRRVTSCASVCVSVSGVLVLFSVGVCVCVCETCFGPIEAISHIIMGSPYPYVLGGIAIIAT